MNSMNMEEIVANQRLEVTLNNVSQVLGSVIGPDCFRLLRLRVRVGGYEPSMSIHGGAQIWLPCKFYGHSILGNEPLAIGLMAHEMSHFLQPLLRVEELIERGLIPHWFSNIVLDVAGESFIQKLLPGFAYSLRTFRSIINTNMLSMYRTNHASQDWTTRLQSGLLAARYLRPELAYYKRYNISGEYRINELLNDVGRALELKPAELPDFLKWMSAKYPELQKQDRNQGQGEDGEGENGESNSQDNSQEQGESGQEQQEQQGEQEGEQQTGSGSEQDEEQDEQDGSEGESEGKEESEAKQGQQSEKETKAVQEVEMTETGTVSSIPSDIQQYIAQIMEEIVYVAAGSGASDPILKISVKSKKISPEVSHLSKTIQVRFGQPQGKNTIVAPGRMHRRELALGGVTPYRMDVTGSTVEGPNVVLCLDESGSMISPIERGSKISKQDVARKAAQAVALAVVQAGGQAHGLIFATNGAMDHKASIDVLWNTEDVSGLAEGYTEFTWLTEVWEKYPESLIVIVTDGNGSVPECVTAHNRKRTVAIVIPPGTAQYLESVCEKTVELRDVSKLATAISTVIPRTMRQ